MLRKNLEKRDEAGLTDVFFLVETLVVIPWRGFGLLFGYILCRIRGRALMVMVSRLDPGYYYIILDYTRDE